MTYISDMTSDAGYNREHYETINRERDLTTDEIRDYLTIGEGATPCSRYGSHSSDMVDMVIRCHEIMVECNGPTDVLASVGDLMSRAVNDSIGPLELIARHGTDEDRETYRDEILTSLAEIAPDGIGVNIGTDLHPFHVVIEPPKILQDWRRGTDAVYVFWHSGGFTPGAVRLVVDSSIDDALEQYLADPSVRPFFEIEVDDMGDYDEDYLASHYCEDGYHYDSDWIQYREIKLSELTF